MQGLKGPKCLSKLASKTTTVEQIETSFGKLTLSEWPKNSI